MVEPTPLEIYAGLSGLDLQPDDFALGDGVIISRTYAHLTAPFLMYFHRTTKEKPFPRHMKAARGGFDFDIVAQIYMPKTTEVVWWGDQRNAVRWLLALLRLWANPSIVCPVISNIPFEAAEAASEKEVELNPFEVAPRYFRLEAASGRAVGVSELEWVRDNWQRAAPLINQSTEFHLAVHALDQAQFINDVSLSLLALWGALEDMFSPAKAELKFRVSATIAGFLEDPGEKRLALQKRIAKLYDARCRVAHGRSEIESEVFLETFELLRQVIIKIINDGHVPTRAELEARLFGV